MHGGTKEDGKDIVKLLWRDIQTIAGMAVDASRVVQFGPSVSVWSPEDEQMAFVPCGIVYKYPLKSDVSLLSFAESMLHP